MLKKFCVLCLACITPFLLDAGIQDYFKKAEGKGSYHFIRNIDFIYMINLDQRPEKFELSRRDLNEHSIYPYRFSAVNGWELSLEVINKLGVIFTNKMKKGHRCTQYPLNSDGTPVHGLTGTIGQCYFSHCLSRGAIGCFLSHISVLQDAYDSGYETVWIMEDDIEIIRDPHLISDLIDRLDSKVGKKNWDILFTDRDTKNRNGEYVPCSSYAKRPNFSPMNSKRFKRKKNIDKDFKKIGARYGAYSFIIRRSGIKKILNFVKMYKLYLPYDMEFYLPNTIKLYSVRNDVVSTRIKAFSDNGAPAYLNKTKK